MRVEFDVRPADTGDFHLHQRGIVRNLRHREFADLRPARTCPHCRQYFFCHTRLRHYFDLPSVTSSYTSISNPPGNIARHACTKLRAIGSLAMRCRLLSSASSDWYSTI